MILISLPKMLDIWVAIGHKMINIIFDIQGVKGYG